MRKIYEYKDKVMNKLSIPRKLEYRYMIYKITFHIFCRLFRSQTYTGIESKLSRKLRYRGSLHTECAAHQEEIARRYRIPDNFASRAAAPRLLEIKESDARAREQKEKGREKREGESEQWQRHRGIKKVGRGRARGRRTRKREISNWHVKEVCVSPVGGSRLKRVLAV